MAITDSQKVDLLWKKVGFSKAKTDTNASKKAPNEANVSDLIVSTAMIWAQSDAIAAVIPSSNSSVVHVYSDAISGSKETTEDGTSSNNRTWKTGITNWIPPSFGATYQLKVYAASTGLANAQSSGTQLFETGSGNEDQWYFDYQSGILHFIGDNLPSDIGTATSNVIYVSGGKYVGSTGIGSDASGASATFRKANLAAVYADNTINEGDLIEVTDGGDGEYAVYIAVQDNPASTGHLTLVSTRDSSGTDAATLSSTVQHNDGNVTLGNVSNFSRPMEVLVEVTTVFDGDTTITIGDDADPDRLMPATYVDLSEQQVFAVNPSYVYTDASDANNTIKAYVTTTSGSQGTAKIRVSYS